MLTIIDNISLFDKAYWSYPGHFVNTRVTISESTLYDEYEDRMKSFNEIRNFVLGHLSEMIGGHTVYISVGYNGCRVISDYPIADFTEFWALFGLVYG